MKLTTIVMALAMLSATLVFGQRTNILTGWGFGLQGGALYSYKNISGLPDTYIQRGFNPDTYNTQGKQLYGFTGGVVGFYRNEDWPWASFQTDIMFSNIKGGYNYEDIEGLTYNLDFSYWYGSLLLSAKLNPLAENKSKALSGLFARLGVQAGLNLNADQLTYSHEPQSIWGNSDYVERELQALTEGQSDMGLVGGIGYEIQLGDSGLGMNVEGKYYYGISDVIQGEPNSYGFDWMVDNRIRNFQVTIGFFFTLK